MAASNTRFTQNSLGQSKNLIDSDLTHGKGFSSPNTERNGSLSGWFARTDIPTPRLALHRGAGRVFHLEPIGHD